MRTTSEVDSLHGLFYQKPMLVMAGRDPRRMRFRHSLGCAGAPAPGLVAPMEDVPGRRGGETEALASLRVSGTLGRRFTPLGETENVERHAEPNRAARARNLGT